MSLADKISYIFLGVNNSNKIPMKQKMTMVTIKYLNAMRDIMCLLRSHGY